MNIKAVTKRGLTALAFYAAKGGGNFDNIKICRFISGWESAEK